MATTITVTYTPNHIKYIAIGNNKHEAMHALRHVMDGVRVDSMDFINLGHLMSMFVDYINKPMDNPQWKGYGVNWKLSVNSNDKEYKL